MKKLCLTLCALAATVLVLNGCVGKDTLPEVEMQPEAEVQAETKVQVETEAQVEASALSAVDFEALGVEPYSYASTFTMGSDMQAAITQLSLCYEWFDSDVTQTEEWKSTFIARFVQNSRMSYAYLNQCIDKNDGKIGINELNYIQYSLTGVNVEFSNLEETVSAYDASSPVSYGQITDWHYVETGDEVTVTALLHVGYGQLREDDLEERQITAVLERNAFSCFDGYSIRSLFSEVITPWIP